MGTSRRVPWGASVLNHCPVTFVPVWTSVIRTAFVLPKVAEADAHISKRANSAASIGLTRYCSIPALRARSRSSGWP